MRKKIVSTIAASALVASLLTGCGTGQDKLKVLATAVPHEEILAWVDEQHDEFALDIKVVSGGPEVNMSVADESADLNFFQHLPYLRDWESSSSENLVDLGGVHIEPMSMYSNSVGSIGELGDGARIAVPNSSSNLARALLLLQDHGLLKLDGELDPADVSKINVDSIVENPQDIEIVPVADEIVIQSLQDTSVAGVIASSNYAMDIGLDPVADAVISESAQNNPYANIVVANEKSAQDPQVQALVDALFSEETSAWITQTYGSAVIPVH
ncbi:MetQ/NlpA family ABC transporter substrate-binding protein [Corynebacterium sp. S7]